MDILSQVLEEKDEKEQNYSIFKAETGGNPALLKEMLLCLLFKLTESFIIWMIARLKRTTASLTL